MSIEAMKRIKSLLQDTKMIDSHTISAVVAECDMAILAQQPATGEPVGFVDFQGTVFWHDGPPPADSLLFAAKPVSHDKAKWCEYVAGMVFTWLEMQENLKEEDRCIKAIAGIIERRMWALLTTHPAPSVPDDVVRDAERWRYAIADGGNQSMNFIDIFDDWDGDGDFVEVFDAAMLAAKDSK